jgi:hypothetical protein
VTRVLPLVLVFACGRETGISFDAKAPVAAITSPVDGGSHPEALALELRGTVTDADTKPHALVTRWLFRGETACEGVVPDEDGLTTCQILDLAPGQAEIRLEVEDEDGETGEASAALSIEASAAPTAALDAIGPFVESVVTLSGTVADADDAAGQLVVWWESSLDGALTSPTAPDAAGAVSSTVTLTPGPQTLVLWVEDPLGQTGNAGVDVTVVAVDDGPGITITFPRDGSRQVFGLPIVFDAELTDPDDPPVDLDVVWSSDIDGLLAEVSGDGTGHARAEVLGMSLGDHVVTAVVTDPAGRSAEATLEVQLDGAPTQPEIRISPADPLTDDTLRVSVVTPSVDPNGGAVSYIFGWAEASAPDVISVGELLAPSDTARGEVWTATVTPWDGLQEGEPATASVTIGNSGPSASVSLGPDAPTTLTDMVATWAVTDPDAGDLLTATVSWTVDGAPAGEGDVLPADAFSRGQRVAVSVVPSDGALEGPPATAEVVIGNARPTAPRVVVVPAEPTVDDDLQCIVVDPSTDPDGDGIVYTFNWDVDDRVFGDAATTDWPQDTVPAEFTRPNQSWVCTVVPVDDLFTTGPEAHDGVEIPCIDGQDSACPAESCLSILEDGVGDGDGTYWIQPGPAPIQATCDLTTDGGGWTLVARVHRAEVDGVSEPTGWFGAGNNPGPLVDDRELMNEAPSAHGMPRFADYFSEHPEPVARFRVIGQDSGRVEATWFKGAFLDAYARWFADDDSPTPVCSDPELTTDCVDGTITTGNREEGPDYGATTIGGMYVTPDCPLHMRLDDDLGPEKSGIAACDGGAELPSGYDDEWGHGLEIWLR